MQLDESFNQKSESVNSSDLNSEASDVGSDFEEINLRRNQIPGPAALANLERESARKLKKDSSSKESMTGSILFSIDDEVSLRNKPVTKTINTSFGFDFNYPKVQTTKGKVPLGNKFGTSDSPRTA